MSAHFTHRRLPVADRQNLLRNVIERAKTRSPRGPNVCVFDLDGTIMDNRPRVVAILHELAEVWKDKHPKHAKTLRAIQTDDIAYRFVETLQSIGIHEQDLHHEGLHFWKERFFADTHIRHDTEIEGARSFVQACYDAGATIVYLTGRDLPNMALGSFASLRDLGFPIGIVGTELVTKPAFETPDAIFKKQVAPLLERIGEVIAVFDNEAENCNLFLEAHPNATAIFVDTQYAPNPPPLDPRVHVIHSFELQT